MNAHPVRLLTTRAAAEYLSVEPKTLENWRYEHRGPTSTHLGRSVRYDLQDLDAWIEAMKRGDAA